MTSRRVHDGSELAAWQGGETRQVYARDQDTHERIFLEDDRLKHDKAYRELVKARAECFMPDCTNRALLPRALADGRDHFKHHSGAGGHKSEDVAHMQGKWVLYRWLEQQPEVGETTVEQSLGGRVYARRRSTADVYASDGAFELAFEVQYASLSPEQWHDRHDKYRENSVGDVWVWGHHRPHLHRDRKTGALRLTPTQRAVIAAGQPLIWLCPERREVLTAWVHKPIDTYSSSQGKHLRTWKDGYDEHPGFQVPLGGEDDTCWASVDSLDDCSLDAWGILTPTRRFLQQQHKELQQVHEQRRAQDQRWAAQDQQRREERGTPQRREQAWYREPRRQRLIDEFGEIPRVLRAEASMTPGIWAHPEQWRAIVYLDLVHDAPAGKQFTVADCYRVLRHAQIQLDQPRKPLAAFLEQLEREHVVTLQRSAVGIDTIRVQRPIAPPEPAPPSEPEPAAEATPAPAPSSSEDAAAAPVATLGQSQNKSYPVPITPAPATPGSTSASQPRTKWRSWWKRFFNRR